MSVSVSVSVKIVGGHTDMDYRAEYMGIMERLAGRSSGGVVVVVRLKLWR